MFSDEFLRDYSWNGNERNRLLVNLGAGQFQEAATAYGLDSLRDGRGLALSDFDGDGDVDLIINNYNAPAQYFVNEVASGHWLQVKLRGRQSNRDGIGATIYVRQGGVTQTRVVSAGCGYASQNSRVMHFGLGEQSRVEELCIVWPSGHRQTFHDVAADRQVLIDEGRDDSLAARVVEPVFRSSRRGGR